MGQDDLHGLQCFRQYDKVGLKWDNMAKNVKGG